jgi:hypothetical protein
MCPRYEGKPRSSAPVVVRTHLPRTKSNLSHTLLSYQVADHEAGNAIPRSEEMSTAE